jgi:hypothetical protein
MLVNKLAAKVIFITLTALGTMHAATFQFTLGTSAGIAPGNTSTGVATWNTDTAGNPAPFNGFNGSDTTTPDFSASWQFSYASIGATILSATLDLGIYDIDSAAAGNQVASYGQGANDLTSLLNAVSEALHGGTGAVNKEYDILSITLPNTGTLFADLAAGNPNFALALQGPGLGVVPTSNNGAGIDFSRLTIVTQDVTPPPGTPEPAAWTLMGAGAVVLAAMRRRRC